MMMTVARSIFISYRRSDSIDITGRIHDRLVGHFGSDCIFKDVDAIPFGADFRKHLEREVSHCPVLLAIIGPQWLAITDNRGRRRLDNPADWVRVEIETALRRDSLVIPVLVGGAELPKDQLLPDSLKGLAYRQSALVRHDPDFHRDLDRLIQRIEGVFNTLTLNANREPAPAPAPSYANLVDDLAAALTVAAKPQPAPPPRPVSRRRWLKLAGLSLLGGGATLAVRRLPAIQQLTPESLPAALADLTALPNRVQALLDPAPSTLITTGPYRYESVTVDAFGTNLYQASFATNHYLEEPLASTPTSAMASTPTSAMASTPTSAMASTPTSTMASTPTSAMASTPTSAMASTPTSALTNAPGPIPLPLVAIDGGQGVLGAPDTEPGRQPDEPPQAIVTVASFWLGTGPVTQQQWRVVAALPRVNQDLPADPAFFKGDLLPVEQVSWEEAMEFCARLSQHTGHRYRLPTETEWEYACRANTTTPFHFGQTLTTDLANYDGRETYRQESPGAFRQSTLPVGFLTKANDFGLYDMHGNVMEWCADAPPNPIAGVGGPTPNWRALRGGCWQSSPQHCRSAARLYRSSDTRSNTIGFRLLREM